MLEGDVDVLADFVFAREDFEESVGDAAGVAVEEANPEVPFVAEGTSSCMGSCSEYSCIMPFSREGLRPTLS